MLEKEIININWDSYPKVSIIDYYNVGYPNIIISE